MKNRQGFFLTGLLIFCSFVVAALISIQDLRDVLEKGHREATETLASRIHDEIGRGLRNAIQSSLTMSHDYFLRRMLRSPDFPGNGQSADDIAGYLSSLKNGLGFDTVFVVSNLNYRYCTSHGYDKTIDPKNDSYDTWYTDFVGSGRRFYFDVDTDQAHEDRLTVFVNCRVDDDNGDLLGVCGVGISVSHMQELIRRYENAHQIKINLVDRNGLIQIDTDDDNIESDVLKDVALNFDHGSEFTYRHSESGGFIVSKFVREFDWYLVVSSERDDDSVYLHLLIRQIIGFLSVMIVLTATIYLVVRRDRDHLVRAATTDGLTGLLNKKAFLEHAENLHSAAESFPAAFIFIDLDNFKKANDTLGHAVGDQILKDAAGILRESFRKDDLIGRFGGDEYVVMLSRLPEEALHEKMRNLHERMRLEYGEGSGLVRITASIGVAYSEQRNGSLAEMMAAADGELYRSKQGGRNRFSLCHAGRRGDPA